MTEVRNGRLTDDPPAPEPAGARGVFETVLLAHGQPAFFREHLERFAAGCAHFGLERAPGPKVLAAAAEKLIRQAGISHGVLRWAAWATGEAEEWRLRIAPPRPHMLKAVWRLAISPVRLSPPDAESPYKHLGRVRWREALAVGRAAGSDEVLLADEADRIVEGAISNVFIIREGILVTPAPSCGLLPGIMRAKVLELAHLEGFLVREAEVALAELPAAEEIFLTNSLVGLRPVAFLDGRSLPAPGPVTRRLQVAWRRLHGLAE
jgi:branched-subunit amino acid aminotransferase/4-amino-4-deoxychorismate lyase